MEQRVRADIKSSQKTLLSPSELDHQDRTSPLFPYLLGTIIVNWKEIQTHLWLVSQLKTLT